MTTILHLDSSIFGSEGQSAQLGQTFVSRWLEVRPETRVIHRDLAAEPLPHLDAATVSAFASPPEERTSQQAAAVARSDVLIDEIRAADVLVVGLPMYNLGVPTQFKAWLDQIARAGVTFRYTETGVEGLLTGKKAYVLTARGGIHAGTPTDTQTPYIQGIFGSMGISDVEFVHAEGLDMGEAARNAAIAGAGSRIAELAA